MRIPRIGFICLVTLGIASLSDAQAPSLPVTPEQLQELKSKDCEADPTVLQGIATDGQPLGRWKGLHTRSPRS